MAEVPVAEPLRTTDWAECPECGQEVIESDAEGLFEDGQAATCPDCGAYVWVSCDEDYFDVRCTPKDEEETDDGND